MELDASLSWLALALDSWPGVPFALAPAAQIWLARSHFPGKHEKVLERGAILSEFPLGDLSRAGELPDPKPDRRRHAAGCSGD